MSEERLRPDPALLEPFRDATARKVSWDERNAMIRQHFPSVTWGQAELVKAFDRDIELMGRILRDVLKAGQAVPGRPGPRPALDVAKAKPVLDRMMGRNPADTPYSTLPFPDAFALLVGDRSLRAVAYRCALQKDTVHRLLRGDIAPTGEWMEKIAKGFHKSPSWFLEYRIGVIAAAIVHGLTNAPDQSVRSYEALWHATGT
jgi:hypothetical protein